VRVAVIGAGIGGLAVATALRQRGLDVEVHEQAERFAEVGAGVAIGANGSRLLDRIGVGDTLRSVAVLPQRIQFHRWKGGEMYCSHALGEHYANRFGAPFYTVHRADLHQVLLDRYSDGVLRLGHRCIAVAEDADGVELTFADGTTARVDVVIGADGVHSAVRTAIVGPDAATFSGTSGLRGLAPVDRLPTLPGFDPRQPALWLFPGPGRHFICYPVSGGRLLNFLAVVPDPQWTLESWATRGNVTDALDAFSGWNEIVCGILRATEDIGRWALYDREPLRRWSTRRTTVLGDAAHAMLPHHGQGANQAVEDAVVLADCLAGARRDRADDITAALHRYESLRKPRSRQLQIGARRNGQCFQLPDGPAARERDARLARLPDDVAWIHGHDAQAAVPAQV
jgi:salicylate hydroxylase